MFSPATISIPGQLSFSDETKAGSNNSSTRLQAKFAAFQHILKPDNGILSIEFVGQVLILLRVGGAIIRLRFNEL